MDVHAWNRKDAMPNESVKRFGQVLSSLGIETCLVQEESYKDHWYSNRIEIKGLPTIGTNGKGITPEYTMASAMGEFFERLQSGMLMDYLFPIKRNKQHVPFNIENIVEDYSTFFPQAWHYIGKEESKNMVLTNAMNHGICSCEDIFSGKKYILPENLLSVLCGSNGLAAGNSFAEAFVQGVSEVFERYATQFIYKEEYDDIFKVIEKNAYAHLNSYKLIQAIEERRYLVRVIDCSFGGKLPVIGVLVFDPSMTKYYFKLGADANVDIALQRCITEVFQGVSFDLHFRMRMKECYASDMEEEGFWFDSNRAYNHTRAEINGTGQLPRAFFRSIKNTTDTITGFCDKVVTNEEAVQYMLGRCKLISDTVGLINYTKYGVPCIRILIPDVCASFFYPTKKDTGLFKTVNSIQGFRTAISEGQLLTKKALDYLIDILNYTAYSYGFNMITLLGIITNNTADAPYLYSPYLFTAYLALYLKEYKTAAKYMDIYNEDARVNETIKQIDKLVIKAFMENVQDEEILQFIGELGGDEKAIAEVRTLINIRNNGFRVPSCPNCDACDLRDVCSYTAWKKIDDSIHNYTPNFMEEEFSNFMIQSHKSSL